jgi:hypothetical protein
LEETTTMKANFISDYWDYSYSINEGNTYKKELGILGPFNDWGYKIKTSCPGAGGETTDQCVLVSGLDDEGDDLIMKYVYGDGKESDGVSFPKSAFDVSGNSKSPILHTRKNVRWWDNEENQMCLDDLLDSFVESKHFSTPEEQSAEGDVLSVMEILGIDSMISKVEKKKDNHWIAYLEDGSEIELKKKDGDDFLRNLKIYLNSESSSPQVEIYRDKPGFETIFNTPKGRFARKTHKITDLAKDPVHKYLFHSSLERDPALYQEPVINYLNSILKSHDWRPKSTKYLDDVTSKEKEMNQIKKMLMNTLPEETLDEMYAKAREKYTLGSSDS